MEGRRKNTKSSSHLLVAVLIVFYLFIDRQIAASNDILEDLEAMPNARSVEIRMRYKSSAILYCNDNDENLQNEIELGDQDRPVKFKELWQNVQFFKATPQLSNTTSAAADDSPAARTVTETPTGASSVEVVRIEYDDNKYIFNPEHNLLIINDLRREDIGSIYFCNSSSSKQSIVFIAEIVPFLYASERQVITAKEGENALLGCRMLYGFENNTAYSWEWYQDDVLVTSSNKIDVSVQSATHSTSLELKQVEQSSKGVYKCVVTNKYGSAEQSVRFVVKDHLAALWPFLGVVVELIAVALIIIFCDQKKKREKERNEALAKSH